MIKNFIKRMVDDAAEKREVALKELMRDEIRRITWDICREMVEELFDSSKGTEIKYLYWRGSRVIDTVVGSLKTGIKDKVISELAAEEKERAMNYIKGEEFLDSVIGRIQRKQLTRPE